MLMLVGLLVAFTSCEKEDVENTATVEMAGDWYVTFDAATADGQILFEDPFGVGHVHLLTYNTAANVPTEMYLSDLGNFWDFTCKIQCVPDAMTFGCNNAYIYTGDDGEDVYCTITGGKIIKNGTKTPSGADADYIEFYVTFTDDPYPTTYAAYGWTSYKVSGFRYTGFTEDE